MLFRSLFAPLSGNYLKYFYNQILNGVGEVSSAASDLVMQGLVNVLPQEALGGSKDEVLKQWRGQVEPTVRTALKEKVGAELPKEKEKQFDENLVTSAIGGIGRMIPAMVSPNKAGIFLQAYDNGVNSINNSEVGKDLPESVKTIYGTGNGIIMKLLMDFQLDKIFGKQAPQVASKITAGIFQDLLKNTEGAITKDAFETAANATVKGLKNKIISTGGNLAKTGLESTLLGTGFGAIDLASKEILNRSTGKKVFDKTSLAIPKDLNKVFDSSSWGEGWSEILHSGASMGIQGLTMKGAFIPFANTDNYIKTQVTEAKSPQDIIDLKNEITSQINEGKISPEDAQRVSDTIDKYVAINSKIPASVEDRQKAVDLIEHKESLKQAAADKIDEMKTTDDAYHPEMQQEANALLNRANELNAEITGQSTEPQSTSVYLNPLELPELKEQISDLNRRIQEGGADGEKAKQELAQINEDPIKFYENRKNDARENLTNETELNKALETYDNIINKIKSYDKENKSRLSGEVGVGEKPIEAKPIEGAGKEETTTSRVLQTPGISGEGEGVEKKVGEKVESKIPEEISSLKDDEIKVFTVKDINEIPEQFRDRAVKTEGLKAEFRKKILGLPIGKKSEITFGEGYRYKLTGKEAKDYAQSLIKETEVPKEEKIIEETKAELPKQLSSVEETSKALDDIYKANPNKIEKLLGEDVVYHGTKNEFDEFNENKIGSTDDGWFGKGFYFHTERNRGGYGDIIKAAKVKLKNPIVLPIENSGEYLYDIIGEKSNLDKSWRKKGSQQIIREIGSDNFTRIAKELGYDGVEVNYSGGTKEIVSFDKNNITISNPKNISEAYHKAKADGSNPELVKAVEDLIVGEKPKAEAELPKQTAELPKQEDRTKWTIDDYKKEINRLKKEGEKENKSKIKSLTTELGSKVMTELKKEKEVKPEETKEKISSPIESALNKYEEGEGTFKDLVNEVESIAYESDNKNLKDAVEEYRKEEEYDRELKGRGDMDAAQDAFMRKIKAEKPKAEAELPKQESVGEVKAETPIEKLEKEYRGKSVDELVKLKKELYPSPDIETPMSKEEKLLDKVIADKFSDINQEILRKRKAKEEEVKAELPKQEEIKGKPKRKASEIAVINRVDAKKIYKEVSTIDEPVDAIGATKHWLAMGNKVNTESFAEDVSGFIRSKGAAKTSIPIDAKMSEFTSSDKKAPSINKAAHDIWESLPEHIQESVTDQDVKNALIDHLQSYSKRVDIAKDFIKEYSPESAVEKYYKEIEESENAAFEKEMKDLNEWMQQTGEEEGKLRLDEDYVNNLIKQYEQESETKPGQLETEDKGVTKGKTAKAIEEVSSTEGTRQEAGAEPPRLKIESGELSGDENNIRGIRMIDNAERRKEIDMPNRTPMPETVEQWKAKAEAEIKNGYNIDKLIKKMENGEATTPVENEISKIYAAALDIEIKENPTNENIAAYKRFINARELASSALGKGLRSLQGQPNPLTNISDFYVAMMEAENVGELTEAQKTEIQKDFDNISNLRKEYDAKLKEANDKLAELNAQNELLKQQKETQKGKVYTKEGKRDFKAERSILKDKLKNEVAKYKSNMNKLGISSDGGAENFAISVEMAKIIKDIVKNHVEEIGANLSEVTKRTLDDVKDVFEGIKESDINDVIAGKYTETKKTKNELQSNLRELQSEAKLLNELDRVMKLEPKEEKQKIEKNKKLADLRNKVKELKKTNSLDEYSDEAKIKRAIERNKTKENEYKEKLAKGDFETSPTPKSVYDSPEFKKKYPKLYKELLDSKIASNEAQLEFEKKLIEKEMAKTGNVEKFKSAAIKFRGTLKAIYAGIDDSAVGVQNWMSIVKRPSVGARAIKNHILDFWSQKRFDRYLEELHSSPDYYIMKESGLRISEPKSLLQEGRDEMFPDRFKAIIKIKGKEYGWLKIGDKKYELFDVLKPFERAFTSLGNSLRVIQFRTDAQKLYEQGYTFENNPEQFKKLATRINASTSASEPSKVFKNDIVNYTIWSPRLMASKLNILGLSDLASFTPLVDKGYYRSLGEKGKILSKQQLYAIGDLARFAATIMAGSYMYATARNGKLDTDPDSDSFMDIVLPNGKSYNFAGGFSKYISKIYQIASGGKKNKFTGEFEKYSGFKDRGSEALHFLRGKMPPFTASTTSLLVGKDYTGKETDLKKEAEKYKAPMAVGQIYDQINRDGYSSLFMDGVPTFLGINIKDARDYVETGLFTKDDTSIPELKQLIDKGVSVPRLSKKETYKVRRDEAHPEGVMTDEEYKQFSTKVHDYMINGWENEDGETEKSIKDILNTKYNVQTFEETDEEEPSKEEIVIGKDLPADKIKNKLSDLKEKAVKKAMEDMNLTKKSKIVITEEE